MFLSLDVDLSSHDETNTTEIIDRMFEEVLEYAGRMEEERETDEDAEDRDSGIGACSGDKDKMDTESEKDKNEEGEVKDECNDSENLESNGDELLTFPPSGILSPLSKSVEAVVTPLVRLTHNFEMSIHDFHYGSSLELMYSKTEKIFIVCSCSVFHQQRLAATQESNPPSLLLTPEETTTPPVESAPLYR